MNERQATANNVRSSPVNNKIGNVFIPVKDIEESRGWYCRILGLNENDCELWHGHLCGLPMEGTGIILDTMPMWRDNEEVGAPVFQTPAFMFMTEDVHQSFQYIKGLGVELVTEIENGKWFVIKDPNGNQIMICGE
ncbi:VOC family protein [Cohnella panacarvi]|uniref:VOC family protein n=1 Tax=Cohnella panacarvi TaxID=400776 RepID=UPI0004799280|nr:VOC family protein [Cohnella panacarvi]